MADQFGWNEKYEQLRPIRRGLMVSSILCLGFLFVDADSLKKVTVLTINVEFVSAWVLPIALGIWHIYSMVRFGQAINYLELNETDHHLYKRTKSYHLERKHEMDKQAKVREVSTEGEYGVRIHNARSQDVEGSTNRKVTELKLSTTDEGWVKENYRNLFKGNPEIFADFIVRTELDEFDLADILDEFRSLYWNKTPHFFMIKSMSWLAWGSLLAWVVKIMLCIEGYT